MLTHEVLLRPLKQAPPRSAELILATGCVLGPGDAQAMWSSSTSSEALSMDTRTGESAGKLGRALTSQRSGGTEGLKGREGRGVIPKASRMTWALCWAVLEEWK